MIKAGTVVDFSLCMEAHRGSYRGIELRHKGDLNPAMCKLSKSVEIVSNHHVIQFTSACGRRLRNRLPVCRGLCAWASCKSKEGVNLGRRDVNGTTPLCWGVRPDSPEMCRLVAKGVLVGLQIVPGGWNIVPGWFFGE